MLKGLIRNVGLKLIKWSFIPFVDSLASGGLAVSRTNVAKANRFTDNKLHRGLFKQKWATFADAEGMEHKQSVN